MLRAAFREQGYPASAIADVRTELGAARAALRWAQAGDLVLFLSHEKRDASRAFFAQRDDSGEEAAP
jgi:hypothetical protein